MAITFDGASANRRFLKLLGSEKVRYKVVNKYTPERAPFVFFFRSTTSTENSKKLFGFKGQTSVGK